MSDYLWDKRGEPDAEVARLETLLGAFAHEPRPLELPGAAPPEPRRPRLPPFASRLFKPAALAAAAALLVASVLVASALLRSGASGGDRRAAAPESRRPEGGARKDERPAPRETERGMPKPPPSAGGVNDGRNVESASVVKPPNVARQRKAAQPAAGARRRQKGLAAEPVREGAGEGGGLTLEAMSTQGGALTLVENARLLTKEQLVYALRFTGAKLKDVREKAQKAGARP
jgi:hypothetical protein